MAGAGPYPDDSLVIRNKSACKSTMLITDPDFRIRYGIKSHHKRSLFDLMQFTCGANAPVNFLLPCEARDEAVAKINDQVPMRIAHFMPKFEPMFVQWLLVHGDYAFYAWNLSCERLT